MGWRAREATLLVTALVLALPVACAVYGIGDVEAIEKVNFPATTHADLSSAVMLGGASGLRNLDLSATRAVIHIYEKTYGGVSPVGTVQLPRSDERSWTAQNATLRLIASENSGFVGFMSLGSGSTLLHPTQAFVLEHREAPVLSTAGAGNFATEPESPAYPIFYHAATGDALYTRTPGSISHAGGGALKVLGPDLLVETAENSTQIATGESSLGAIRTFRWAYILFEDGTLRLDSPVAPIEFVSSSSSRMEWNGTASLVAADGNVTLEKQRHVLSGPLSLTGDLVARVHPVPGSDTLRVILEGEFDATAFGSSLQPSASRGTNWWALTLGIATVASMGTAGLAWWQRRRSRERISKSASPGSWAADDCRAWAEVFEEIGDLSAALECLTAARQLMEKPTFALLQWEAGCLEALGRPEEAVERLKEALAADPTPREAVEAAIAVATIAPALNRPEEALAHLRLALMGDPAGALSFIQEMSYVKSEDPFAPLRNRAEFRQLLREAREWAKRERQ